MPPSDKTLKYYGLSYDEWEQIMARQIYICPICQKPPTKPVIDHQHVKGFKRMKPAKRKSYVRGVLCRRCNWRFLGNLVTVDIACRVADYLRDYLERTHGH